MAFKKMNLDKLDEILGKHRAWAVAYAMNATVYTEVELLDDKQVKAAIKALMAEELERLLPFKDSELSISVPETVLLKRIALLKSNEAI